MRFLLILLFSNLLQTCQSVGQHVAIMESTKQAIINYVSSNDIDSVKSLLDRGVDVNTTDGNHRNLLLIATVDRNTEMAALLVSHGGDVNMQSDNLDSPFLYAGASGQTHLVKLYLENGARFDIFNRYNGTALITACERGHIETVKLLVNTKDFPIDHVNRLGWTALLEAIVLGDGSQAYQTIVQLLKDGGADLEITDREGKTPWQLAKERGFDEIVNILQCDVQL